MSVYVASSFFLEYESGPSKEDNLFFFNLSALQPFQSLIQGMQPCLTF